MLYRSHFSFAAATRLTTKGGQDTSIEYGFLGSVRHYHTHLDGTKNVVSHSHAINAINASCPLYPTCITWFSGSSCVTYPRQCMASTAGAGVDGGAPPPHPLRSHFRREGKELQVTFAPLHCTYSCMGCPISKEVGTACNNLRVV